MGRLCLIIREGIHIIIYILQSAGIVDNPIRLEEKNSVGPPFS